MKENVDSEPLDKLIDALKDQIHKYNLTVSEYNDNRRWEEGVNVVASMNERINSLLKEANDHLRKLAEVSRQKSIQRYVEDEDEMDEIEKLSEKTMDREDKLRRSGNRGGGKQAGGAMRTAQEKEESRSRKRIKKKPKGDH